MSTPSLPPTEIIHRALKVLAGVCDFAQRPDGVGFNAFDTAFGHELAMLDRITLTQAAASLKMLRKYAVQLSEYGITLPDNIGSPSAKSENGRIYLEFPGKPDIATRDYLKSFTGFRWHPDMVGMPWSLPYTKENAQAVYSKFGITLPEPTVQPEPIHIKKVEAPVITRSEVAFQVKDNSILVTFPVFNRANVELIKSLPERKWLPDEPGKPWAVPSRLAMKLVEIFPAAQGIEQLTDLANHQRELAEMSNKSTGAVSTLTGLTGTLYPFQHIGVEFLEKANGRALIADEMGLGKTIQAIAYLAQHPELRPAVIVVPASLKINWRNEITKWLATPERVAVISGTKTYDLAITGTSIAIINYDILNAWKEKVVNWKPAVVISDESHYLKSGNKSLRGKAMQFIAKSVSRVILLTGTPILNRPNELWPLLNMLNPHDWPNFFKYAMRYCLPHDAPILMSDLTEKAISEIKIGDTVIGWNTQNTSSRRLCDAQVTNVLKRTAKLQTVILEDGTQLVCTPDHRWLTGYSNPEYQYLSARTGHKNQGRGAASWITHILEKLSPIYINSDDYKKGYLAGIFRGDGYCSRLIHELYQPFREKTTRGIKKHSVGLGMKDKECIDRANEYLLYFGFEFAQSIDNKGIYRLIASNKDAYDFIVELSEPKNNNEWWAGFLGGIYDAEGSGQTISQYLDKNPVTYNFILEALTRFDVPFKQSKDHKGVRIIGGRKTLIEFWNIASPVLTKKLKSYLFNGGGKFMTNKSRVLEIIPMSGEYDVFTLTTTTGNYVAYGCGSKNCNAHQNGFGWDFSGASNLEELFEITRPYIIRRRKDQVLTELPPKVWANLAIEFDPAMQKEYQAEVARAEMEVAEMSHAQQLVMIEKLKQLAVRAKLPGIISWITDFLETGEKLLVFATHHSTIHALENAFPDNSVTVTGETQVNKRQSIVERFQTDDNIKLFFGNIQAAGVGLTLTAASNVLFIEFPWRSGDLIQAADRTHRLGQENSVTIYMAAAEGTIDEDIIELLKEKMLVIDAATDGAEVETVDIMGELVKRIISRKG